MTSYGFIGVGHLGAHLAGSLLREGFPLTVNDISKERAEPLLARGARWADTPRAAASQCEAVITCLPSPSVSEVVLCGPDGILDGLAEGSAWIEMSTVGRDDILRLAARADAKGVATLEAPVTGGVHRAAAGEITILCGGPEQLLEAHRSALAAMGGEIFHVGPLGSAALMKVITNMLAFVHLVAAGEALMLAKRGGIDLNQAYHAIKASSGNSFVHQTESQLILNGSYKINFTMERAIKDLGFAMSFGKEFGVPLDLASMTTQTFIRAREAYGSEAWSTMVVKLLEDALRTDLRAPGFPAELIA
jgi:3-hydroxyisobutyrate dehydrogenase